MCRVMSVPFELQAAQVFSMKLLFILTFGWIIGWLDYAIYTAFYLVPLCPITALSRPSWIPPLPWSHLGFSCISSQLLPPLQTFTLTSIHAHGVEEKAVRDWPRDFQFWFLKPASALGRKLPQVRDKHTLKRCTDLNWQNRREGMQ